MTTSADERYQPFRDAMRRKHGYCGPYRLGIAIGEAGEALPCPYENPRSFDQFEAGRKVGIWLRARHQAQVDIRTAIWNAARNGGMGQDAAIALVERAMQEPTMMRAIQSVGVE